MQQVPPKTSKIILHRFRWDLDKIADTYYQKYDQNAPMFFREANIVNPFDNHVENQNAEAECCVCLEVRVSSFQTFFFNSTCFDCSKLCLVFSEYGIFLRFLPAVYFHSQELTGLQCGHEFCKSCLSTYLTDKINEDGKHSISCLNFNCGIILDDDVVKLHVTDPNVIAKYETFSCNSFVEVSKVTDK